MVQLARLLSKGYFPRELPPPFNTSTFAKHAQKVGPTWPNGQWTRCVAHNLARPGGLRRPLKIPQPVSYFALAQVIAENWESIEARTQAHRLSASRPYVMKSSDRAVVPRYKYGELTRIRALRRRGAKYLLITDIDQFYPTIYSHAIPWALHSKAACKEWLKKKGKKEPLLGDLLDRKLRTLNDGQTHGIPIGPDTSLVVAEILLAAADEALLEKHRSAFRGFRYVDDYELAFTTLSEAEQVLSDLQGILSSYELLLNPRKTRIVELPYSLDSHWSISLKAMMLRPAKQPVAQRNDLLALFSRAYELASQHPSESVLRYAVAHVQGLNISAQGWRAFHNCILNAAGADPSTLPTALGTLHVVARRGGHAVPKQPLAEVFESVISRHAPRGQGGEVAWALWGALAWNVSLSAGTAKLVDAMEDDIVALLAMHASEKGLFPDEALTMASWKAIASQSDVLQSEHWLLAYEANQQGWLNAPAVAKNSVFRKMAADGVAFYDRSNAKPQFPRAGRAIPGGELWSDYA